MITGLCAKATIKATLITEDGRRFIGMNWCRTPQARCPREPGEGYEKCATVCSQYGHAEIVACCVAGTAAEGATLYLEGHTYVCGECLRHLAKMGVYDVFVGVSPPPVENPPPLSVEGNQQ